MKDAESIRTLKGIGEKTEKLFQKLGIETVGDLLRYYPRDYEEYRKPEEIGKLVPGKKAAVAGQMAGKTGVRNTGRMTVITAKVRNESGELDLIWYNMPFLRNTLLPGGYYVFRGTVTEKKGKMLMEHPEIFTPARYEEMLHTLIPVYGLTKGLTNKAVIKVMHQVLEESEIRREYLPEEFRNYYHLAEYNYAVSQIHFPENRESMLIGRRRLVFDEFLFFVLAVGIMKEKTKDTVNHFSIKPVWETETVIENLPYPLTNAQKRVWSEMEKDMTGHTLMSR
ncbi:MAG: ATP-dependent DNA helicase RecG, partial [Blautia sp.]|nr:ATP-dependent DNA helicase RecG [Blautia sp.]